MKVIVEAITIRSLHQVSFSWYHCSSGTSITYFPDALYPMVCWQRSLASAVAKARRNSSLCWFAVHRAEFTATEMRLQASSSILDECFHIRSSAVVWDESGMLQHRPVKSNGLKQSSACCAEAWASTANASSPEEQEGRRRKRRITTTITIVTTIRTTIIVLNNKNNNSSNNDKAKNNDNCEHDSSSKTQKHT